VATFGERLKQLRAEKKLTQKSFAATMKITERAYQNYEIGASTPHYEVLMFLADYFGVSLDYLVGRSDDPEMR
jgi:transcriptional regulator with XRE-family HTH domain